MLDGVHPKRLGVEVPELGKLALGTDDVRSAEQIARTRPNFPVHHVVVGLAVALDQHAADAELLAFHHADLDVNRVAFHPLFNGARLEREVAVVLVQGTQVQPLGVHEHPGLQPLHAEHFPPLDVEQAVELRGSVLRVSCERDVPEVERVAFLHPDVQDHLPFRVAAQAVAQHARIAVARAVVVVDHVVQVGLEAGLEVLRRLVEPPPAALLGVFHLP